MADDVITRGNVVRDSAFKLNDRPRTAAVEVQGILLGFLPDQHIHSFAFGGCDAQRTR
ncbi:MAG: hypothetical protein JF597_06125 [Streptomyces sp.]|uniref:hypothetical protein n=1 Tax=Streptomyces sp. TaxID=1931 RepID=UPI0025EB7545|nr:hypothetical protein [Streptomyces sp.]MBW8793166.1 hypothetical protein [Streptomyces sp.]